VPLSYDIIKIWINPESAEYGAPMLRNLAIASILGSGANVYFYFTAGTGQYKEASIVNITNTILTIIFSAILLMKFGPLYAGIGAVVAGIFRMTLILRLSSRYFKGTLQIHDLIMCKLPIMGAALLILFVFNQFPVFHPTNLLWLGLDYFIISVITFLSLISITFISGNYGRQLVLKTSKSLMFKF
jgi:O-antigen/teichoic acid export membrane protein